MELLYYFKYNVLIKIIQSRYKNETIRNHEFHEE